MEREVISAFPIHCEGVSRTERAPLRPSPTEASVTVFKDGSREVGCPYLISNKCMAGSEPLLRCIQLFPARTPLQTTALPVDKENLELFEPRFDDNGRVTFRQVRLPKKAIYEIDSLGLPTMTRNALLRAGIVFIRELVSVNTQGLLPNVRYVGRGSIRAIEKVLASHQ